MMLDTSMHLIYGYKNSKGLVVKALAAACERGELTDAEHDRTWEELTNNTGSWKLFLCEDTMCGDYEYLGLSIRYEYCEPGEDCHWKLDLKKLERQCDDEQLDRLVRERAWLSDLYDEAGLFDGELPSLYFVKRVW